MPPTGLHSARSWTVCADSLAAEVRELGARAGQAFARAVSTGLDQVILVPLATAATALGQHAVVLAGQRGDAYATATDLDDEVADLAETARSLASQAATMASAAEGAREAAQMAGRAAGNDPGAMAQALAVMADCDAAGEILASAGAALEAAAIPLASVPAVFADAYDAALALVRKGHRMPSDGGFFEAGTSRVPA